MGEEQALYVRDGDAFIGTSCTKGSWHANGQSGGAVLALLGHALEDVATLAPMSLSRFTVDIVRPVPVGERLWVDQVVVREGKRIQVVDSTLRSGDGELVRARALRVRDADLGAAGVELPSSTTDDDPAATLPPPAELEGVDDRPGVADFLRFGAELRRTGAASDVAGAWVRLRVPVVAGEPVRATSRAALPMDCVNLIGVHDLPAGVSAVNADVSAHVLRPPVGEWVALVGSTRFGHHVGHGVSMATLSDADGVFGVTSTSQVVQLPG